eukprot:12397673-Karenia_brevis.AAC.1
MWKALLAQGVPTPYVELLSVLYSNKVGHVVGRSTSKAFKIGRGTKQGDPLSPSLFNSVLEFAMQEVTSKWKKKRWGIRIDDDMLS